MNTDPLTAPLPRSLVRPKVVYGRRGKLPPSPDDQEYRCSCGKFQFRGVPAPGSRMESWCDRCRQSVIFET
jgi:hypothetical protein